MNQKALILALITIGLLVFSGCKKDTDAPATTPADVPAEIAQAADSTNNFFGDLEKLAVDAGDDCEKLGSSLNEYLSANKAAYIAAAKNLDKDDGSANVAKADSVMKDDSPLLPVRGSIRLL